MLSKTECKHEHTRKNGILILSSGKFQRVLCKDCGLNLKGKIIDWVMSEGTNE